MNYNFVTFKQKTSQVVEWLKKELGGVRTGRATPLLLDGIEVLSYGSRLPLNQVASIVTEDSKTLRIAPWDNSHIREIEKSITLADLGLSISVDDKGLRVIFPDLTSERRLSLVKIAKKKLEEAKIALRSERDEVSRDIQQKERNGEIGEDDKFRFKEEMEKIVGETESMLVSITEKKEQEISS